MKRIFILLILLLNFPVSGTAQEIQERGTGSLDRLYEEYEDAFLSRDLEQILNVYAENALVLTPDGNSHRGLEQIRKMYKQAFKYFPENLEFKTQFFTVEDNIIFHVYHLEHMKTGEESIPFAAETIVIDNGKIRHHTIAEYNPIADVKAPVPLKLLKEWIPQTSLLPRYFAPNLYEGIADYAFAPGMFEPEKEDHFTYVMVLWVPTSTEVNEQKLETDLETYFNGLSTAAVPDVDWENAENEVSRFFDSLATRYSVSEETLKAKVNLEPAGGDDLWNEIYHGTIRLYESAAAHETITLNSKIRLQKCPASGYRVIIMQVSRQPFGHQLWGRLEEIVGQWQCPEEN